MEVEKNCLSCSRPIFGRVDKKFCSDACRNAYNNEQNRDVNNFVRRVNHTLRKNRRILAELNPDGKMKVHGEKLNALGFDFNFYTSTYTTKKGTIYFFCYEHGYLPLENNYYALVIRQEYLDPSVSGA